MNFVVSGKAPMSVCEGFGFRDQPDPLLLLTSRPQGSMCFIPKAMVGWERRMWSTLTEREALSALEHLRIEIQVHSNSRLCVNIFLIY